MDGDLHISAAPGLEGGLLGHAEALLSSPVLLSTLVSLLVLTVVWCIRDSLTVGDIGAKCVLITGCDSGFGNLLARQLDQKGFHVVATCLTEGGALELQEVSSPRLKTVQLNLSDAASVDGVVELVRSQCGDRGLWGLVNNAGRSVPIGPTEWMQVEDFKKVLDVNLMGPLRLTLQLIPMLKKAQGRVVNVASIMGRVALTGGGYCISKAAVESFSDSLRRDMRAFGVHVSVIEPGFFKTAVTSVANIDADLKRLWERLPEDVKDSYGEKYLTDYIRAQRLAMSILCSGDISKVTGCMQHALMARHPRSRYGPGWDAKLVWLPLSYAPTFIADFIIGVLFPIPRDDRIFSLSRVYVSDK